jgi:hypothetical protein
MRPDFGFRIWDLGFEYTVLGTQYLSPVP